MADSKKTKAPPISMDTFRAKKAGAGSSGAPKTAGAHQETKSTSKTASKPENTRSRPQSATSKTQRSRSASADSLNSSSLSIESRQEKVKQLRDKQVEERKKKNEERRLAFEERRKQKQDEEKNKWDSLKQMASIHRPGSGRKLPTLPDGPKRPSTAGSVPARPTGLPKSLKTTTTKLTGQGADKKTPGSPSRSSSSLSSDSSPKQSPTTHAKNFLSACGAASSGSVNDTRRASTSNLYRSPSASKKRPSSIVDDSKVSASKSHTSLAPASRVKKAQSTSALHQIDIERPFSRPKKPAPKKEKPKAGMLDEAAAKQALAERRKQAREEAERKAKLDLERQEVERKIKEEEDRKLAEEVAKEEERVRQLTELLQQQEEERLQKAMEEKEVRDREEAERLVVEEEQREEERKIREEEERLAKIEAEKKAKEDEERRKQEEKERQERRRRVEEIMSRTRQTKTGSPNLETVENMSSSTPPQETKDIDVEDTKRKVTEILQKVKDRTEGQESPVLSQDKESHFPENSTENAQAQQPHSENKTVDESANLAEKSSENNEQEDPKPIQEVTGVSSNSDSVFKVRVRISETRTETKVIENEIERTLTSETSEADGNVTNGALNGHNRTDVQVADLRQHNAANKRDHHNNTNDEERLWKHTELIMQNAENSTSEKLENAGIVAEGDNDPNSEEGKLWRVIEGSSVALSDVA